MKRISFLLFILFIISCDNSVSEVEQLKYSEEDLRPLEALDQIEYYKDAAFIEFWELSKDSLKRLNQVELDYESIRTFYDDLLLIYNNSYRISNSFFEYAKSLHSYGSLVLYTITVSVDTNKEWISNWNSGIKTTGHEEIDRIISDYDLDVELLFASDYKFFYKINSEKPMNYLALMEKLKNTDQFLNIEPAILIGGGANITLMIEDNTKNYTYYYGWGDCTSGCLHAHYWIVKVVGQEVTLVDEGGDILN